MAQTRTRILDKLEAVEIGQVDMWFLRAVRDRMKAIVQHDLADEALRLCRVIRKHDLLVGLNAKPDDHANYLPKNTWSTICQRYACRMRIPFKVPIVWIANVGSWHKACWELDRLAGRPEAQLPVRNTHLSLWDVPDA